MDIPRLKSEKIIVKQWPLSSYVDSGDEMGDQNPLSSRNN